MIFENKFDLDPHPDLHPDLFSDYQAGPRSLNPVRAVRTQPLDDGDLGEPWLRFDLDTGSEWENFGQTLEDSSCDDFRLCSEEPSPDGSRTEE